MPTGRRIRGIFGGLGVPTFCSAHALKLLVQMAAQAAQSPTAMTTGYWHCLRSGVNRWDRPIPHRKYSPTAVADASRKPTRSALRMLVRRLDHPRRRW
ncbi:hypothetical protein BKH26_10930 [Actinomyces oris]|nr:hypothetical protein BKH26_10930 [Actinomyces oris]